MSNNYPAVPPVGSTGTGDTTGAGTESGFANVSDASDAASDAAGAGSGSSNGTGTGTGTGTKDEAKAQASKLGHQAADAGQHVTGVAKDEASKVVSEAKTQVKDLYGEAKDQLREQAGAQQARAASGLHSLSDELKSMAENSETQGLATDLAHQVSTRAASAASWLDGRDPGSLLDEVRQFARQRPGTFIAIAAVAGVLAGRLTRNIVSEAKDEKEAASSNTSTRTTDYGVGGDGSGMSSAGAATSSTTGYDDIRPLQGSDDTVGSDPAFDRPVAGSDDYYLGEPRP